MFLDTSIIIEILISGKDSEHSKRIFELIENENISISIIQLGELSDWCLKNGIDPEEVIGFLKDIVSVMPLEEGIVVKGSRLKHQRRSEGIEKFSLTDGIILACALELNERLLTLDTDFCELGNVIVLSE